MQVCSGGLLARPIHAGGAAALYQAPLDNSTESAAKHVRALGFGCIVSPFVTQLFAVAGIVNDCSAEHAECDHGIFRWFSRCCAARALIGGMRVFKLGEQAV